jgi:hypothetical protein
MSLSDELEAQEGNVSVASRADEIQLERMDKARNLRPNEPDHAEQVFVKREDLVRSVFQGPLRLQIGGLPSGSGFAAGPRFEWTSRAQTVRFDLSAIGSIHSYYTVGAGVVLPGASNPRLSFAIEGAHSYAPSLDYYGPGPNSSKDGRTDYLREETPFGVRIRWRPTPRHVTTNFGLGMLLVNVGPGTRDSIPSTESVYGPSQAPGIDVQPNFVVAGSFVDVDFRDNPGNPHKGTHATLLYERYSALSLDQFSFNQVSTYVEHYVPFWNEKRVIALRAGTQLSYHNGDQVVPFYLQPTLGGADTLRGFPRYRFYDENSILFNAEYRWEGASILDVALFADAGKVFNRPGQISLSNLESSFGFGFRFKTRENVVTRSERVVVRIDFGFSNEGFQSWLRFDNVF